MNSDPKIAIIHDWLVTCAGAERVLEQLITLYPHADLFSLVDFLPPAERGFLLQKPVKTTFLQRLPLARTHYRNYLPLMPVAIEQLDVSEYDLIISSSHAVAKGVLTGPDQIHISYVHSPMRYAWDLHHQYLAEAGLARGLRSLLVRFLLHYMRLWDTRTSNGVDHFVANSNFIARRIGKIYRRDAKVIYPPVDTTFFDIGSHKEDFYVTASRMVPYKKISLIVKAFSRMPEKKLVVIGEGPEFHSCRKAAGPNIEFLGWQPIEILKASYQRAKAFVFAAEEDFGISPVEAQACGTPVIAYGKGGALEAIAGLDSDCPSGVFFSEQTVSSLMEAVLRFEANQALFQPVYCRENALRFSSDRFRFEFTRFVEHATKQ